MMEAEKVVETGFGMVVEHEKKEVDNKEWLREIRNKPPIKKYSHGAIIWNYFYSMDREHYRSGCNVYFKGDYLFSYGAHFPLCVVAKNCFVINADRFSSSTSGHQYLTIRTSPHGTPQIPFSALEGARVKPEDIYLIDKSNDEWRTVNVGGREVEVHHLGASLFRAGDRYFLSFLDRGDKLQPNRRLVYCLVELNEPATSIQDAFFQISGLEVEEYIQYMRGEIRRQGEFFFIPVGTTKELKKKYRWAHNINANIIKWVNLAELFRRDRSGRRTGNPHKVRDLISVPLVGVLVRGTVRHPEHGMLKLGEVWHSVKINYIKDAWTALGRVD